MSIAFDNVFNTTQSSFTTYSTSYTTSGSNRVLLAFFWAGQSVNSITYNSVAMTNVKTFSAGGQTNYIYILVNPASGSNTFSVTFAGSTTMAFCLISYNGCAQSGQPDASNNSGTEGSGNTDSNTLSSVADNCWHIGNFVNDTTSNITAGTGTTKRSVGSVDNPVFDNNAVIHPAGSNTLNVNLGATATQRWNSSVTLAPFVAVAQSEFLSFF